eukprot:738348-Hanusia_phi.AAC.6
MVSDERIDELLGGYVEQGKFCCSLSMITLMFRDRNIGRSCLRRSLPSADISKVDAPQSVETSYLLNFVADV